MYRFATLLILISAVWINSCGSSGDSNLEVDNEDASKKEAPATAQTPKKEANKYLADDSAGDNKLMESRSYKQIAAFLPESVDGVKGGPLEGWIKTSKVGHTMAKKSYKDTDKKTRIDLSIADAGKNTLASLNMNTYWAGKSIDKQSGGFHEKTTTFEGHPAFTKCNDSGSCDFIFSVDNRFLISGFVQGLSLEELKEALRSIDVESLKKLTAFSK